MDVLLDCIPDRHQGRRADANPIGHSRDVDIDPFIGVDIALAIERLMRPVLAEHDLGQQVRPGAAARNRMRRRRSLDDRIAFAAGELLPHVHDHFPLRRHALQAFGLIRPELAEVGPAAAWTDFRRRINDALARQMRGKRAPCRTAARRFADRTGLTLRAGRQSRDLIGCRVLCDLLLQLGELQLQLVEQPRAFGGGAEFVVLQLGDCELQVLDLGVEGARTGLGVMRALCCRDQHGLERRDIVRKLHRIERHGCEHSCFALVLISIMTIIVEMGCQRHREALRSSGNLRPPCLLRRPPVDPFEHIAQLRRRYRHRPFGRRRPDKAPALQSRGEQTGPVAVMPDDLQKVTSTSAKDEQMAGMRILLQRLLDEEGQGRKTLPHIGMAGRKPDPHARRNRDHPRPSSATIIRTSAAGSTSVLTRTVRPPAIRISIVPGFAGAMAAGKDGAAKATGTKAGIGVSGVSSALLQRNKRLGLIPCRRATAEMFRQFPEASATIAAFSASDQRRRVSATTL